DDVFHVRAFGLETEDAFLGLSAWQRALLRERARHLRRRERPIEDTHEDVERREAGATEDARSPLPCHADFDRDHSGHREARPNKKTRLVFPRERLNIERFVFRERTRDGCERDAFARRCLRELARGSGEEDRDDDQSIDRYDVWSSAIHGARKVTRDR